VVDLGCGPGQLTDYLHRLGVQVIGVDPVPEFISHAKSAYARARFEVGSLASLGVDHHTLSGILAWYSLIHVAPTELDSVLAPLGPGASAHSGPIEPAKRDIGLL
jgi:trans-aconitate methyltransferase